MIGNPMGGAAYFAPEISVMSIETECGFAQSYGEAGHAGKLSYDVEDNNITF